MDRDKKPAHAEKVKRPSPDRAPGLAARLAFDGSRSRALSIQFRRTTSREMTLLLTEMAQ
jgi:hypothetical protein